MSLFPRIEKGYVANDGLGDHPRTVATKINTAFDTLDIILEKPISDAAAAAGSANSASASAAAASVSQTAAAGSATSASGSATAAGNSATAAAGSATSASTSAGTATTQAGIATTQAGTATTQAGIATTQAGNASTSATNAGNSATAAGNSATAAGTSATNAATSATNAATSETNAAASAARLTGTSASSVPIATGSKVFTTQSGKDFNVGSNVKIVSGANPANYFFGDVTAYSGTTLTVNVTAIGGSGTFADWTIQGRTGLQGIPAAGTGDVVGPASSVSGNIPTLSGTTGKIIADSGKAHSVDGTLASNSDAKIPTEKAVKTYADSVAASATSVASIIHAATSKATPVDADELALIDSAASNVLKKLTWANLKTTLIAAFKASASAIWAGTSDILFLTPKNVKDSSVWYTITSSTTPAWDTSLGNNGRIVLAHNATFGAPTNLIDGWTYPLLIVQDATGSRTGAFNSIWDFGGAGAPTLSTAAGSRDLVTGIYDATTAKLISTFRKGT